MQIRFIRNDITKIQADAVVDTANPYPVIGGGTDAAIYKAAGEEKLLAARREIGNIESGDARITNGFDLSRYIIHTVGPKYIDGSHNEEQQLRSCYRNSLSLAKEHQCSSVVFPLISTGVYGFPKEEAIWIALSEIQKYLLCEHSKMEVIISVFDDESYVLCNKIAETVESHIDSAGSTETLHEEYGTYYDAVKERQKKIRSEKLTRKKKKPQDEETFRFSCDTKSFAEMIRYYLSMRDEAASVFYKAADIDRRLFSKLMNTNYHPSKDTVIRMCVGLRLTLPQSVDLLSRADYAFNPSKPEDLVIMHGIRNGLTWKQIEQEIKKSVK